ncbi:MAG: YbjN domain-containing protein [Beijerinckiaceae bacterium]|nr:YbjN domain-containing protein [Beijerinckiaceae bacterium]
MSPSEFESERNEHPVDKIERIASLNEWAFDREGDDEISITVEGKWTEYHVAFTWLEDIEALHVAAAFDMKVPERRRAEMLQLISQINEQMWIGHFDYWTRENVVMFRHSLILAGGAEASASQCESMLSHATDCCERYYQAFQFVVWAGKTAREAMETAMFETMGEA